MLSVNINKLMKYPSRASKELGAIHFSDDQNINSNIEKVMGIDEQENFEELTSNEPTLELKTLPSTL